MTIQNENSLLQAIQTGINIFTGSGFSTLAKDKEGHNLPTGGRVMSRITGHI